MPRKLISILVISFIAGFSTSCDFPFKSNLAQIAEDYNIEFLKPILKTEESEAEKNHSGDHFGNKHHEEDHYKGRPPKHGHNSHHDEDHELSSHHELQDHEKHGHSSHHGDSSSHHHSLENIKFSKHQVDYGILWVQNSAEYSALCHQAYNIASLKLEQKLVQKKSTKKAAIILDLDETVLDNSPFQAKLFLNQDEYTSEAWDHWVELAEAEAIPGAKTFLDSINPQKVEIFYVSNRHIKHLDATLDNMKKLEIPVKKSNILLKENSSSKEIRRKLISENYEILLLLGDNLIDFSPIFDAHPSSQFRYRLMETLHDEFGDKFIVLPNPNYGQWLSALHNYDYELSRLEKYKIARESLLSF
ncbi:MAG: 5'-nucleotidase, lipoprotein e(P4) family [Candidatus Caenarcaniphilales bacterium]|nr:5'-nucleotidase, lipoprotein e(P4) family [Candidatus Caenarcaniphilales bacterium]